MTQKLKFDFGRLRSSVKVKKNSCRRGIRVSQTHLDSSSFYVQWFIIIPLQQKGGGYARIAMAVCYWSVCLSVCLSISELSPLELCNIFCIRALIQNPFDLGL